jgi:hypothetical protein
MSGSRLFLECLDVVEPAIEVHDDLALIRLSSKPMQERPQVLDIRLE